MNKKIILSLSLLLAMHSMNAQEARPQIKKDEAGRPFFIDKENDKIVIIDFKSRQKLKEIAQAKDELDRKALDYSSFYQVTSNDNINLPQKKIPDYKYYEVEKNETWEDIAFKLYKDRDFSSYLKLWNEDLLGQLTIPEGAKIKYVEKKK